jgi:PleD family two-component response regulator
VVLLRETDLGNAFLLAERLRQQISGGAIEAGGKKIVSVTALFDLPRPTGRP